jgi:glutamate racemase
MGQAAFPVFSGFIPMSVVTEPRPILDRRPRLLVFDSGIGGLSVLREIRRSRADADVVYVADDAGFPYGNWDASALTTRIVELMDGLIERHRPDMVVIACNTASTLVLPALRARHALPFVGTVPAIKPAAAVTKSGLISVLATPGTVKRDYTRALIDSFAANISVTLVGSVRLAGLAERWIAEGAVSDAELAAEILPCFVDSGERRTDAVVLACTHYPFLIEPMRRLAPWPVNWIDPAPAIARRVVQLIGPGRGDDLGEIDGVYTSGATMPARIIGLAG